MHLERNMTAPRGKRYPSLKKIYMVASCSSHLGHIYSKLYVVVFGQRLLNTFSSTLTGLFPCYKIVRLQFNANMF